MSSNSGSQCGHELLVPLTTQACHERIVAVVHRVEMSANTDAALAVQPRVATRIGPSHAVDAVAVGDDDIGDQLLVGRIGFGIRPIQVAAMFPDRRAEVREIARIGLADSVEVTSARHRDAGQDEHLLGHPAQSIEGPVRSLARWAA